MKLLDTNKIIELFVDREKIFEDPERYAISRITYVEILSWSKIVPFEAEQFSNLMSNCFKIFELDEETSDLIGKIKRRYDVSLGDSIILGTAIGNDLELVTNDKRLAKKYNLIRKSI